jgi:hypothetical protein
MKRKSCVRHEYHCDVTTKTKTNAVPLQAIVRKPPQPSPGAQLPARLLRRRKGERAEVSHLDKDNRVKFIEVATGITGESDIEITSGLGANRSNHRSQPRPEDVEGWRQSKGRRASANANKWEHN